MHRAAARYVKALEQQGAVRVLVLPYPYARGHLRVRDGAGCERFLWFDDAFLLQTARAYCQKKVVWPENPGDDFLRSQTYAHLLDQTRARQESMDDSLRMLIRLCMDAGRPQGARRALAFLERLYPARKAQGDTGGALYGCAAYLCSYFSDFFEEKCLSGAKMD